MAAVSGGHDVLPWDGEDFGGPAQHGHGGAQDVGPGGRPRRLSSQSMPTTSERGRLTDGGRVHGIASTAVSSLLAQAVQDAEALPPGVEGTAVGWCVRRGEGRRRAVPHGRRSVPSSGQRRIRCRVTLHDVALLRERGRTGTLKSGNRRPHPRWSPPAASWSWRSRAARRRSPLSGSPLAAGVRRSETGVRGRGTRRPGLLLQGAPRHGYEAIRLLEERLQSLYAPFAGTAWCDSPSWAGGDGHGLHRGGRKVDSIADADTPISPLATATRSVT